ncbi:MAG: hypothetical protein HC905_10095 [Bacteroidales bacterium]|nr:hypothetical protein [Bacteroidales bacterium]
MSYTCRGINYRNPMTLSHFNKLSLHEKGEYTFKSLDVSFVAFRDYYNHRITLYASGSFFIEVYFSRMRTGSQ